MKEIRTEIDIAASPDVVWRILTEFERYPEWNRFLRSGRTAPRKNGASKKTCDLLSKKPSY